MRHTQLVRISLLTLIMTPVYAETNLSSDAAYKAGQMANLSMRCQNEFTPEGKEVYSTISTAYRNNQADYLRGFDFVSQLSGYAETEKQGLGTPQKNLQRTHFCNWAIESLFPDWAITD